MMMTASPIGISMNIQICLKSFTPLKEILAKDLVPLKHLARSTIVSIMEFLPESRMNNGMIKCGTCTDDCFTFHRGHGGDLAN